MIINDTIIKYEKVLSEMQLSELNLLKTGLNEMRELGVGDFGYRSVDRTGRSNLFTTNLNWHKMNKSPAFWKRLSEHMSSEILYAKKNNLNFITRSDYKVATPYLKYLEKYGINNSVATFEFGTNKIEIFYFLINSQIPHCRDVILYNLRELNHIIDKMRSVFQFLNNSSEFQNYSLKILDDQTIKLLWRDDSRELIREGRYTRLVYKDKEIFLSPQPLRCLIQLRLGQNRRDTNNRFIASKLNLSEATVKNHIQILKRKFGVLYKSQLVAIMQSEDMQYLDYSKSISQLGKAA